MLKGVVVLIVLSVLVGCRNDGLNIKIRYDKLKGLNRGDRVIFEQNDVGNVMGIFYSSDGHYMVDARIKQNFSNAVTEHSRFFVIDDPQMAGKKAVEMIQIIKGGLHLEDGAVLVGSTRSSAAFAQMEEGFRERLEELEQGLEEFIESLSCAAESENFNALQGELERLAEEMVRLGELTRDEIEEELLPRLREEIDKLRERLRKWGREEEVRPLEIQVERMTAT